MILPGIFRILLYNPRLGERKSGTPAFVEIPAPHIMTTFLYAPLLKF